jgi:hypothetical protein
LLLNFGNPSLNDSFYAISGFLRLKSSK